MAGNSLEPGRSPRSGSEQAHCGDGPAEQPSRGEQTRRRPSESCGPVAFMRIRKEDGRQLILYSRAEPER